MLTLNTRNPVHGIATGDTIQFLTLIDKDNGVQITLQPQTIRLGNGMTANPSTNEIQVSLPTSFVWPFTQNVLVNMQGSIVTASMERNLAKDLGFTVSMPNGSRLQVVNIGIFLVTCTLITNIPHRMEPGSIFRYVADNQSRDDCVVVSVINDFTIGVAIGSSPGCIPGSMLHVSPDQNYYLIHKTSSAIDSLRVAPNKIDLSRTKRHVLIRCLLNGSQEIGNVFLPNSNMRFLAQVQLRVASNSIQFSTDSDIIEGSFLFPTPVSKVDSIRLELYSDDTQELFDLQGVDWSLVAHFVCDNEGN
jgi:hypothetical protein